jgi:hypothetical protein
MIGSSMGGMTRVQHALERYGQGPISNQSMFLAFAFMAFVIVAGIFVIKAANKK